MQCCGAIYHLVDPKIDKNRQNPQDTCSKIPGRVFSEGAEPPEAITTSRTARGGTLKPVKMSTISQHSRHFSKLLTFQNLKIEILKCAWERFPHIQKSRYGEKSKIGKIQVFGPHSYQHSWVM